MKRFLFFTWMLTGMVRADAQFTAPIIVDQIPLPELNAYKPYDWDNDGDLDFIGATPPSYKLSWQENVGGQLAPAAILDTATYYSLPILGDINGDNRTDIIYNSAQSYDSLGIRLQMPNGSFAAPIYKFRHSGNSKDVKLADCDNDGDVDIIQTDLLALRWYENDGAGNFEPPHFIADPTGALLHIADVNNDGLNDILAADVSNKRIYHFRNLGGGSFMPKILAATLPDLLHQLKSADLNGDGLPDLLPVYRDDFIFTPGQAWLRNTADGKFALPQSLDPTVSWLHVFKEVATGDVDNDGDTDVMGSMSSDSLMWFENTGGGQFSARLLAIWPEVQYLENLALSDFDADGLSDLSAVSIFTGISLFKNEGGGQFAPRLSIPAGLREFQGVGLADINQDNQPDLLAVSGSDGRLVWYPNLGTGQFGPYQTISNANYNGYFNSSFARAGDLDGDGDLDILSGIPKKWTTSQIVYELVWYKNDGTEHFGEKIRVFPPGLYIPVSTADIADMNGDGKKDIVCLPITTIGTIAWIANDGAGGFGFPQFLSPSQSTYTFTLIDLDGDMDKDILVTQDNGTNWYANDGSGHFGNPIFIASQADYSDPLFAEDFDSDGDLDIISGTAGWWAPNLGNNTFPQIKALGSDLHPSDFADLNQDGKPDLIGSDYAGLGWKPNLGGGVLGERIMLGRSGAGHPVLGADLSGDGDQEIIYSLGNEIGYFDNIGGLPYISGYCFWDENENGLRDSSEKGLPDIRTILDAASQLSYSDEQGQFRFYVSHGDYVLSFLPDTCWILSTDSATYHLAVSDTAILDRYFGFKLNPGAAKLESFVGATATVCGRSANVGLLISNRGCRPAMARQQFVLDPAVDFEWSDPAPGTISGDTVFWDTDLVQPGETRQINLTLSIPLQQGAELHFLSVLESLGDDGVTVFFRDTFRYASTVLCAYDPNDKLVDRPELEPAYLPENNELTYTVRFQNTGTYLAFNVRIRDTLDAGLDWPTLRPLAASHAFFTNLDAGQGIVEFNFPNILLADSTSNEAMSHGFVAFAIRPKPGLPEGTLIPNRAGIYFDYNPPVITNYAETRVKMTISVRPEASAEDWLSFFPNPASGFVHLQFRQAPGQARVRVFDLQGRVCLEKQLSTTGLSAEFDVSGLPPAAYLLEVRGENGGQARAVLLVQ